MSSIKNKDTSRSKHYILHLNDSVLLRRGQYSLGPHHTTKSLSADNLNGSTVVHQQGQNSGQIPSRIPAKLCIALDILYHMPYITDVVIECEVLENVVHDGNQKAFEALRDVFVIMRELTYKYNCKLDKSAATSPGMHKTLFNGDAAASVSVPINLLPFLEKLSLTLGLTPTQIDDISVEETLVVIIHLLAVFIPSFKEIFPARRLPANVAVIGNESSRELASTSSSSANSSTPYMLNVSSEEQPKLLGLSTASHGFLDYITREFNSDQKYSLGKVSSGRDYLTDVLIFSFASGDLQQQCVPLTLDMTSVSIRGHIDVESIYDLSSVVLYDNKHSQLNPSNILDNSAQHLRCIVQVPIAQPTPESNLQSNGFSQLQCQSHLWCQTFGDSSDSLTLPDNFIEETFSLVDPNDRSSPNTNKCIILPSGMSVKVLVYIMRPLTRSLLQIRSLIMTLKMRSLDGSSSQDHRNSPSTTDGSNALVSNAEPKTRGSFDVNALQDITQEPELPIENCPQSKSMTPSLEPLVESIERDVKLQVLEEQGDLSLVNRRLKESGDMYRGGWKIALENRDSESCARLKQKERMASHLLKIDCIVRSAESGEEALMEGKYSLAREHYSTAAHLRPNCIHLQTIVTWIDKTVQALTAIQKIDDAHAAMKAGKYRVANQLFSEAIILVPDKAPSLQKILDGFAPLMQFEDALVKQKAGLTALDDKRYSDAVLLLSDAIDLVPKEKIQDKCLFLPDRAQALIELKEFERALQDCDEAIMLRSDHAVAHFRRGTVLYSLDRFEDAIRSYERAEQFDQTPAMSATIKVRIRQVNTAKEVQQRKERELERLKAKEDEKKILEERKAKEEQMKKERLEKALQDQSEKSERFSMKKEDLLGKSQREEDIKTEKAQLKELEKEKVKLEKAQREKEKAVEREKVRVEKEKEREQLRIEKIENLERQRLAQEVLKQQQKILKDQQDAEAEAKARMVEANKRRVLEASEASKAKVAAKLSKSQAVSSSSSSGSTKSLPEILSVGNSLNISGFLDEDDTLLRDTFIDQTGLTSADPVSTPPAHLSLAPISATATAKKKGKMKGTPLAIPISIAPSLASLSNAQSHFSTRSGEILSSAMFAEPVVTDVSSDEFESRYKYNHLTTLHSSTSFDSSSDINNGVNISAYSQSFSPIVDDLNPQLPQNLLTMNVLAPSFNPTFPVLATSMMPAPVLQRTLSIPASYLDSDLFPNRLESGTLSLPLASSSSLPLPSASHLNQSYAKNLHSHGDDDLMSTLGHLLKETNMNSDRSIDADSNINSGLNPNSSDHDRLNSLRGMNIFSGTGISALSETSLVSSSNPSSATGLYPIGIFDQMNFNLNLTLNAGMTSSTGFGDTSLAGSTTYGSLQLQSQIPNKSHTQSLPHSDLSRNFLTAKLASGTLSDSASLGSKEDRAFWGASLATLSAAASSGVEGGHDNFCFGDRNYSMSEFSNNTTTLGANALDSVTSSDPLDLSSQFHFSRYHSYKREAESNFLPVTSLANSSSTQTQDPLPNFRILSNSTISSDKHISLDDESPGFGFELDLEEHNFNRADGSRSRVVFDQSPLIYGSDGDGGNKNLSLIHQSDSRLVSDSLFPFQPQRQQQDEESRRIQPPSSWGFSSN